ncbi:DUF4190 domain-containing protein [Arthrobacter sp. ISL-85]|uniref:DUF4190 domain-containing protein n=1 Tax=Arthrobacter sp. ISL-85 TaxID=2819115 RepID=UPI001BEC491E|nr:DUF4190 domain-containing protein [Arthrobacter sp. ISL-85]MBT2566216.1 DUF4190 domain-containing protein [Arthrobacter sp. ISL-85]
MSTPSEPVRVKTGLNKLAVTAVFLAAVAALGYWTLGVAVLTVFAVGAGHVSVNQVRFSGESGRGLAIAALSIGYAIATFSLVTTLSYLPVVVR